jgi:hypothetical protein
MLLLMDLVFNKASRSYCERNPTPNRQLQPQTQGHFLETAQVSSQSPKFRSGIFLHHSTGDNIWGPNGSITSVPLEIASYNLQRGLTGQNAVSLRESWWPVNEDNEWETWHRIFENRDTREDVRHILDTNRIVIIKSCFPSSNITGYGAPTDLSASTLKTIWNSNWRNILKVMRQRSMNFNTLAPMLKTMWNHKWHWRTILNVMRQRPTNFFVIWTNAPLVASATNDQQAVLSDQFCHWAKDTLAQGLDPEFGTFPANVYVFDFFHKLAGADGKLPLKYAVGSSDSHLNSLATQLVAPQLVSEVFDAALRYEKLTAFKIERGEKTPPRSVQ